MPGFGLSCRLNCISLSQYHCSPYVFLLSASTRTFPPTTQHNNARRLTGLSLTQCMQALLVVFMTGMAFSLWNADNLVPLAPFGASGVLQGAVAAFFGFLGFDEVLTQNCVCGWGGRDFLLFCYIFCYIFCYDFLFRLVLCSSVFTRRQPINQPLFCLFDCCCARRWARCFVPSRC